MSARVPAPALALAGLFLFAATASAQQNRYGVGLDVIIADPVGEFADFVDVGGGIQFHGRVPLDPAGIISLRGELGFLMYGYESKNVCFEGVGCRVEAQLQTSNNIFFGGMGPELALPTKFARPYVNATMGFGYFNTSSSLEDYWGGEDHFLTENFGDGTFAWAVGWGMEMLLSRGRVPIALNMGAQYHQNGVMRYLTEGDIQDNPDGSITLYPNISEANLITYHFGVTVNLR
jgi:hypothetical protein